jgi:uncharacterized membrane protein YphA (DoxX/SURF4 family)
MTESTSDAAATPDDDFRPETAQPPVRWSVATRTAFRFCVCYLLPFGVAGLFMFAEFMFLMSKSAFWNFDRIDPWRAALPWICAHIFRIHRKLTIYPDADYLSGYLQHLVELILALAATIVWSILDRKRSDYRRLYAWFAIFLRFSLAIVLFSYGFDKVFPMQFGLLTSGRLSQQVGGLDIFNMLWIFMASSHPYTIISGAMEVVAGLLLLIPRLEMLGALLAVPVLTNVFLLNMDYGVPVKIVSSHLLLVALFLAAPPLLAIVRLLVLRQSLPPIVSPRLSSRRTVDRAIRAGVAALGVVLALMSCTASRTQYTKRLAAFAEAQRLPFSGFWIADTFSVPAAGSPSLFTLKLQQEYHVGPGTDHWLSMSMESPKHMNLGLRDGVRDELDLDLDPRTGVARLNDSDDPAWKATLTFQSPGHDLLTVVGTVNGVPISSTWHRKQVSDFRLVQERFRWIQPDNN